jgi:hypothetical protein
MKFSGHPVFPRTALIVGLSLASGLSYAAQGQQQTETGAANSERVNASLAELQSQVRELKAMVLQLQEQTLASRAEISRLREELQAHRSAMGTASVVAQSATDGPSPAHLTAEQVAQRLDQLNDDQQLLSAKIDEQYQTKLESASKYRVRFSGIVLFNLFGNRGSVDNLDVPTWAVRRDVTDSSAAVGGTLRQSILGFEVFGPEIMGAHSSASINFDFGGGFPATYNGVNFGLVRLRTAELRLDWKNTSVIAGQDQLFFSPLSPTTFASLIVPGLSGAGNLWSWTPQLRLEHRFALPNDAGVSLQGGVLDSMTGEPPAGYSFVSYRAPNYGEASGQPAYAARVAYSRPLLGQTFTLGAGGYYARQDWGFGRTLSSYATTLDWNLPLSRFLTLSGEFYRGQAIGGLGAALGRSILYNGDLSDPDTRVIPVNSTGGWAQLKLRVNPKLEFNAAFGQDNPFAADIRQFGDRSASYVSPYLTRNRGALGNVIYRPRSDLLLSLEYHRLRTFTIYDNSYEAGQVNMSMGVLF